MRLNTAAAMPQITTHEGAPAKWITPYQELRRSVASCLLWENEFYESGEDIASRIQRLAQKVDTDQLAALAVEARSKMHLRHAPLLLLTELIRRGGSGAADTIASTIQRPDEMAELLAIYWRGGKRPLSKQLKLGLAIAMAKFDEYQLAKYDREGPIKLRDVLFLSHAKPDTPEREALYKRIANRELATPDTWEVALSSGADKRATWIRLLEEEKLGYLALLRNVRNMTNAGVEPPFIAKAILGRKGAQRVLPFRYIAAARACPQLEPWIDQALLMAIGDMTPLPGRTAILVDVSGSMDVRLSAKSDMTRMDAAAALAAIFPGDVRMFSFSDQVVEVPPRRGMAGVDALIKSQPHGGTRLGLAVAAANVEVKHDRLIVITDEQSHDRVPDPVAKHAYMINVASAKNGVGYGRWKHVDGFSEAVLRWIAEVERGERGA